MAARIRFQRVAPGAGHAMLGLERYVGECGLDSNLLDLVRVRASQINGCAFCLDMHWKDLRARGVSEDHIYMLDAWREADIYSDRERAALAWTEAVTLVAQDHVPDEVYEQARAVQRRRAGQPDNVRGGDQRLEPPQRGLPHPSRHVPTEERIGAPKGRTRWRGAMTSARCASRRWRCMRASR